MATKAPKTPGGKKIIGVSLAPEDLAFVQTIAVEEERSVSQVVSRIIRAKRIAADKEAATAEPETDVFTRYRNNIS